MIKPRPKRYFIYIAVICLAIGLLAFTSTSVPKKAAKQEMDQILDHAVNNQTYPEARKAEKKDGRIILKTK